jgi:hypothetical protein
MFRRIFGAALAACIGLAVVAYVFGTHILPPGHTGWMLTGTIGPDPVQYWLGYSFFKRSPWTIPPGLNPDWGLEIGSSIFYSDSIPVLAFLFKALHPFVEISQYWGLWLYACGALQAWLAFRLIGLATPSLLVRLAGAALFVLQPTLLNRMGGHFALGGQWLLLAALYLCLTERPRPFLAWVGLATLTALIHAYFVPMVLGFWAADFLARALPRDRVWPNLAAEAAVVPGAALLGLWAAGFFTISAGFAGTWGGYGQMQLDLLSPFDPQPWGAFLPDLPNLDHMEAGHSYAGLGALLALLGGAVAFALRPLPGLARRWPLALALLAMLLVAISHRVAVGGQVIELFSIPEKPLELLGALRASERFFWPLAYTLLLGAIVALVHALGARRAGPLLALLVAVQLIDLQPGFARLARYFPADARPVAPLRLADPFWLQAAPRYARVRLAPTGMQASHWEEVAVYAATLGLPTDAVYLARLDPAKVEALNAATLSRLRTGNHEPGSLYVLGDETMLEAARQGMDASRDLLEKFDGVWVLAPGWHAPGGQTSTTLRPHG